MDNHVRVRHPEGHGQHARAWRLIIKDIEPITGKSTEVYSLPWKSVSSWAFVNSNKITEFSSTLRIWMSGELMAIRIRRGVDLNKIDAIIAQHVL